jgi:hypothetical protein
MSSVIDLRIKATMREEEPFRVGEEDRLVETLNTKKETIAGHVMDKLHVHVETLRPERFLEGAKMFLDATGLSGFTMISIDEQPLSLGGQAWRMNLRASIDCAKKHLEDEHTPPRTIEISSSGKNEWFSLWVNIFYRRKHRIEEAPVEVEVKALSNELGPKDGESFTGYKARMRAMDSDLGEARKVYDVIDMRKKILYADYAHHLSEAFPGVRLQVYESVTPTDA